MVIIFVFLIVVDGFLVVGLALCINQGFKISAFDFIILKTFIANKCTSFRKKNLIKNFDILLTFKGHFL